MWEMPCAINDNVVLLRDDMRLTIDNVMVLIRDDMTALLLYFTWTLQKSQLRNKPCCVFQELPGHLKLNIC